MDAQKQTERAGTTNLMLESFRWYGPDDSVPLGFIRQTGAKGVFTALHGLAYGELWPLERIEERKAAVMAAGLEWTAVESVPVHEDIKTRGGDYRRYIRNYQDTLRNLGRAGIGVVVYNFMPVLDWVRTDMARVLADGSECLFFDLAQFAAFDMFFLQRKGAGEDYPAAVRAEARMFFEGMNNEERALFERDIIDVFPGTKLGLNIQDVRKMLALYEGMDRKDLKMNMRLFLEEVVPVAKEAGVRLAVHPDDPPWGIMGLPRIVSCAEDFRDILSFYDDGVNGICFCTGSLSAREDNDLPAMVEEFGSSINAVHLRSTRRKGDGSFYEANHLEGGVDMCAVVRALLLEQGRRREAGRGDWQLAFRPDHGHTIMDDLEKPRPENPGYSAIGRMRGLAEIRGIQRAFSMILSGDMED